MEQYKYKIEFQKAAWREFEKASSKADRAILEDVREDIERTGPQYQGLGYENKKVRGDLWELKIHALRQHRFLWGYVPWKSEDGRTIIKMVRHLIKKAQKLPLNDIEVALGRLVKLKALV